MPSAGWPLGNQTISLFGALWPRRRKEKAQKEENEIICFYVF
jgi:hypothetical protein